MLCSTACWTLGRELLCCCPGRDGSRVPFEVCPCCKVAIGCRLLSSPVPLLSGGTGAIASGCQRPRKSNRQVAIDPQPGLSIPYASARTSRMWTRPRLWARTSVVAIVFFGTGSLAWLLPGLAICTWQPRAGCLLFECCPESWLSCLVGWPGGARGSCDMISWMLLPAGVSETCSFGCQCFLDLAPVVPTCGCP